jgi:hypothetical protein
MCHQGPDEARKLRPELSVRESAVGCKSLVRLGDGQLRFKNMRSDGFQYTAQFRLREGGAVRTDRGTGNDDGFSAQYVIGIGS